MMSIKSLPDAMRGDFWPRKFDFTHYGYVFEKIDTLPVNLFNSIYVTAGTVLITTICAVLAGYALVHLQAARRRPSSSRCCSSRSISRPASSRSSAIYEIQDYLGLINSTSGLILPYVTLNLAISVLIMRSVFQLVPHELIEAAKIDGAGAWRTLWMVGLPMVAQRPGRGVHRQLRHRLGRVSCCARRSPTTRTCAPCRWCSPRAQGGIGQWAWPRIAAVYVIVVTPGIIAFTFAQSSSSRA